MAKKHRTGKFSGRTYRLQPMKALDVEEISRRDIGRKRTQHRQIVGFDFDPTVEKRRKGCGFPDFGKRQTHRVGRGSSGAKNVLDVDRWLLRSNEQHTHSTAIGTMINIPNCHRVGGSCSNFCR